MAQNWNSEKTQKKISIIEKIEKVLNDEDSVENVGDVCHADGNLVVVINDDFVVIEAIIEKRVEVLLDLNLLVEVIEIWQKATQTINVCSLIGNIKPFIGKPWTKSF